jgi:hypothetical protein
MLRFIVALSVILSFASSIYAEMIYLKDGQVVQGKIVGEGTTDITVQTQFQTKRISRNDILRIMYGERKMEKIYLLMNDGTTQTGFLVDQDASQVIIRDKEDSPKERTIAKSLIKQMSTSGEIVPLDPSISIRGGRFYPFNSKGAKLKPAAMIFGGSDFNLLFIKNTRFIAEAGWAKNKSKQKGVTMQFIPIQAGLIYDFSFSRFHIMPKATFGTCIIDFNDGEGGNERSFAFSSFAGIGLVYELAERHFYAGLWSSYAYMKDKSSYLHGVDVSLGFSYRF